MRLRRLALGAVLLALLAPAVLLTALRVWRPWFDAGIQAVAFAPFAVPLYAAAVVVLLVTASRAERRPPALIAGLVVCLPLALHLGWLAPRYTGGTPEPASRAVPVRVLTANLWHGQVGGLKVVQAARRADADLVVLAEIRPKQLAVMENGGIGEGWPHRAGGTDVDIAGTMVFSRYPIEDVERLPTRLGGWRMTVRTPDGPWRVVAVHVTSPVDAAEWRSDHEAVLDAARGADLVVGDLNATPDHRPFQRLEEMGLRDAAELLNAGRQPTWPANNEFRLAGVLPLPPLVQIDHVLLGPALTATRTSTTALEGTDHLAVLAEVAAR